jgi:hypothetical protein
MNIHEPRTALGDCITITPGQDLKIEERDFVAHSDKSIYSYVRLLSSFFLDFCNIYVADTPSIYPQLALKLLFQT